MAVLLSTYESREGQPQSPPQHATELLAARFGTVAAAPEGRGALVARGALASGARR